MIANEFLAGEMPRRNSFGKVIAHEADPNKSKSKKIFQTIMMIIAIMGVGAFPCFIMEESMQTAMFGAFAYNNADDMEGLSYHLPIMKATHHTAQIVIYSVGWLSPLTFPAYCSYLKNNAAYIRAMERQVASYKNSYSSGSYKK